MFKKIGFMYFSYHRVDSDELFQQVLLNFEHVVFFDLRNLFPEMCLKESEDVAPFSKDKLPHPPVIFRSMSSFKAYLKNERIVIINGFGDQKPMWRLSYLLNRYKVPMIGVQTKSGLDSEILRDNKVSVKRELTILKKIIDKTTFFIYLVLLYFRVLSKYDLYFISGERLLKGITKYKIKYKEIIYVNSSTYDYTLNHKENTINESDFIVFLDFAVPFIADFEKWGFKAIDPDLYYSQLNNFFCLIEKLTSKTVVICAHPQFNVKKKEKYFPNREVVWFKTNAYVEKSSFVLVHFTNAVHYAIIHNKPILLLDNDILNPYIKTGMDYIKNELNLTRVDYNSISEGDLLSVLSFLKVDLDKYNQFKMNFLINPGDEGITSSKKIINIIKEKYCIK